MNPIPTLANEPPWSCVCRLTSHYPNGTKPATGWLSSRCAIVTAAHSVSGADHVVVEFRDRARPLSFSVGAKNMKVAPLWLASKDKSWDLAVLRLSPQQLDASWPWLACNNLEKREVRVDGRRAAIAGYPNAAVRMQHAQITVRVEGRRLCYGGHTGVGVSGAPIFINVADHHHVVGVHTHGADQPTRAVFLDDLRASWIDEADPCP